MKVSATSSSPSAARSAGRVARASATGGVAPREWSRLYLQDHDRLDTPPVRGFAAATLPAFGGGGRFDIRNVHSC